MPGAGAGAEQLFFISSGAGAGATSKFALLQHPAENRTFTTYSIDIIAIHPTLQLLFAFGVVLVWLALS